MYLGQLAESERIWTKTSLLFIGKDEFHTTMIYDIADTTCMNSTKTYCCVRFDSSQLGSSLKKNATCICWAHDDTEFICHVGLCRMLVSFLHVAVNPNMN